MTTLSVRHCERSEAISIRGGSMSGKSALIDPPRTPTPSSASGGGLGWGFLSTDLDEGAAIHRERNPGNEIGFVRGQEQRGVGDVPGGAHLAAQRHLGVALGGDLGAASVAGA